MSGEGEAFSCGCAADSDKPCWDQPPRPDPQVPWGCAFSPWGHSATATSAGKCVHCGMKLTR